jgi:antitoxin MazE
MRVEKWGDSPAIRLPAAVVEALGLKDGDEVEAQITRPRTSDVDRDLTRERALARLNAFRWKLPPDWKFDRDDAHSH